VTAPVTTPDKAGPERRTPESQIPESQIPEGQTPEGQTPERLLLRLEWRVVRRLEGRLGGGYRTVQRGGGTDLAGLRAYTEGDDARHIDWNVTARMNEPQLRVFNEERELTVWLVLDRSASMTVGRPGRGKHDVLSGLAVLLARLFSRGGNKVGALLYDNGELRTLPPGTGRRHVLQLAARLAEDHPRAKARAPVRGLRRKGAGQGSRARGGERESTAASGKAQPTDLSAMLDAVGRLARRRSLIVVISDFIGEGDWERSLLRLGPRHEVAALRVTDAADDELPEAGLVVVEDAETGEQLVIDSSDPLLRARLRDAVEARQAGLTAGMRRAGVPVHRVGTEADLAAVLVDVISSTRRRRG
jgi:uncharacterized protein (DUF58 family)